MAEVHPVSIAPPDRSNAPGSIGTPDLSNVAAETKPRQTKSRDGCRTCKVKRLKCDETKPGCLQCKKRSIDCGGYKKHFTFRTFEQPNFPPAKGSAKVKTQATPRPPKQVRSLQPPSDPDIGQFPDLDSDLEIATASSKSPPEHKVYLNPEDSVEIVNSDYPDVAMFEDHSDRHNFEPLPPHYDPSLQIAHVIRDMKSDRRCHNLEFPQTWHCQRNQVSGSNLPRRSWGAQEVGISENLDLTPTTGKDMVRDAHASNELIIISQNQDLCSDLSVSAWSNTLLTPEGEALFQRMNMFNAGIDLRPEDSGLLHKLFIEQTCGILSIKDGPSENPWRTMLWPLALREPALYYAILALAASHAATNHPPMRTVALEMQARSFKVLADELESLRTEVAIATALVLAFSESWLSQTVAGMVHLRGARLLLLQTSATPSTPSTPSRRLIEAKEQRDLSCLQFLRSTWVYMDILARLTSLATITDAENIDSIALSQAAPSVLVTEVDPLMGCATTLFPIIGNVATLVRCVRQTGQIPSSDDVIERASDLKARLLDWYVPTSFNKPEDQSVAIEDSVHTAEAYRWATLLYLYQAVPEICTEVRPIEFAKRALHHMAAVPPTSRVVIIHIFPILAAGCEAENVDDRAFVRDRFALMIARMQIGNLDRCWDVIKEVWARRDDSKARETHISSPTTPDPHHSLVRPEQTVLGHDHWNTVMAERKWEILLG